MPLATINCDVKLDQVMPTDEHQHLNAFRLISKGKILLEAIQLIDSRKVLFPESDQ